MIVIAYRTGLSEVPRTCSECTCHWCHLPMCRSSRGGITDKMKKEYMGKRHKECPLIRLEEK